MTNQTLHRHIQWLLKEKYHGIEGKAFKKDVQRLELGEPIDYVIGFKEFLGCRIDLSKTPLIPRVETEFWVEKAIQQVSSKRTTLYKRSTRVLDIFAGSGCIGVAVAKHAKGAHVTFADSEKSAVEQIKINCKINSIESERYRIFRSNIFKVANTSILQSIAVLGTFDYIFANPPYIPNYRNNPSTRLRTILRNRIQKSVLKFEPERALFGGEDGLFYIKKFLVDAKNFLKPHGVIFMEFDPQQKKVIEKLLKQFRYAGWEFHKDQYRKWRWVSGTL